MSIVIIERGLLHEPCEMTSYYTLLGLPSAFWRFTANK